VDLSTTYMGFQLPHPLVVGASPMVDNLDVVRRLEDAGAAMIVMHSLFEEQIVSEEIATVRALEGGEEWFPEATNMFARPADFTLGPDAYLEQIARLKEAVSIPIIASLNGTSDGGWVSYAGLIEQAGADGLELNLYELASDFNEPGRQVEYRTLHVAKAVREFVSIPVAVKLSPFYTSVANMARCLDKEGINALVLFNRFYQPDIELESLEVVPNVFYSTPMAMRLPMRWIAILHDHIGCSLAATSGIHRGTDASKMLMSGADVTMLCSVLLRHGLDRIRVIEQEMMIWMQEHEYESVEQLKGSLSQKNCPNPAAFERAQYMRAVGVHKPA